MSFDDFEKILMQFILREPTGQNVLLAQQYAVSEITSRKFTGCGFFTDFYIPNKTFTLPESVNLELWCLGELEGVEHGVGFILFVRDGVISMLEGYVNTGAWPEYIGKFQLNDVHKT